MTFQEVLNPQQINAIVAQVAAQINDDYADKQPLFIVVLKGAFFFASDLLRHITIPNTITFVRLKSYTGMQSSCEIREIVEFDDDVKDKDVIVIEDIVDTGNTMQYFKQHLREQGVRSLSVVSFLFKKETLLYPEARPDYIGLEIPKRFVIGYGFDIDEAARNLPSLYMLNPK